MSASKFNFLTHNFQTPVKIIKTEQDIRRFERSRSFKRFKFFIEDLSEHLIGQNYTQDSCDFEAARDVPESKSDTVSNFTLKTLDALLNRIMELVDETPLIIDEQTVHRFGNLAYRDFFDKVVQTNRRFVIDIFKFLVESQYLNSDENQQKNTDLDSPNLPPNVTEQIEAATEEVLVYLNDSFGNKTRIDYGSGHEAAFIAFLACLYATAAISSKSSVYKILTVNKIFRKYLKVCRLIQSTYKLEPAGSKGNFGLDDFQFCCYIFGGAQLRDNPDRLRPDDYTSADRCARYRDKYMFFEAVDFIHQVKSGPFSEHSNQLWNISGAASWEKIHLGMIKKYADDVLRKFPVMQHFYFGSIFPKPF